MTGMEQVQRVHQSIRERHGGQLRITVKIFALERRDLVGPGGVGTVRYTYFSVSGRGHGRTFKGCLRGGYTSPGRDFVGNTFTIPLEGLDGKKFKVGYGIEAEFISHEFKGNF